MEEQSVPRPFGLLVTSALLAAFSLYAALRTPNLMRDFRGLFEGLGAEIPPLTKFVLNAPNLWWVIATPAILVFVWIVRRAFITPSERDRMRRAVIGSVVFGALVYGIVAYALYVPLFKLGAVV